MTPAKGTPVGIAAARSQPRRVLVVEDDPVSLEYFRHSLGKSGFAVSAAESAQEAKRQLAADGFGAFDCVVTDYRMPGESGLDLLAWLQQEHSCLATIILTAEGEKRLITESLRAGAADFL